MLRAEDCDVNLDFDSLAAKGSALGSAGIMIMDSSTCMVRALLRTAHFFAHESCGQCTPCREGTGWFVKILKRLEAGDGLPGDPDPNDKQATSSETGEADSSPEEPKTSTNEPNPEQEDQE